MTGVEGTVADHVHTGDLRMRRLSFGAFLAPHHPREYFNRARQAVMAKIAENPAAAAALKVTKSPLLAASAGNVPDLDQAASR
jgi:hypothetical protein